MNLFRTVLLASLLVPCCSVLSSPANAAQGDLLVAGDTRTFPLEEGVRPGTPVFSPDGKLAAAAGNKGTEAGVFTVDVAKGDTRRVYSADGAKIGDILFGPASTHLAAVVTAEGKSRLAAGPSSGPLADIPGTDGVTRIRWAGDTVVCAAPGGRTVWKIDTKEAGPFERLPGVPGGPYHPIAWSADGTRCAAARMVPSPTTGLVRPAGLFVWDAPAPGREVDVKELLSPGEWLIGVYKRYAGATHWSPDGESIRFVGTRLKPVPGRPCRPLAVWEIPHGGGEPKRLFEYGWWPKRFQMRPGGFGLIAWRYDMGSATFCTDLRSGVTYRYKSGAPGRGPFTFGPGCRTVAIARWDGKKKTGAIAFTDYTIESAPQPAPKEPARKKQETKPSPPAPAPAPKFVPAPPPPAGFTAGAADIMVSTDRSPHPRTRSSILRAAMAGAKTDEERAIALWRFVATHMYHYDNHGGSVWDVLCTYGCSLCGTMWRTTAWLANDPLVLGPGNAGGGGLQKWYDDAVERREMCKGWLIDSYMIGGKTLDTPVSAESRGGTGGHTMGAMFFDGRSHFMDPMAAFYVYSADGDHIASLDEIKGDQSLVGDPVRMSEPFMPCDEGKAIFFYRPRGAASGKGRPIPDGPPHAMNLRSGMKYTRYYGRTFPDAFHLPAKRKTRYVADYWEDGPRHYCDRGKGPRHRGNGEIVFEPAGSPLWREAPAAQTNLAEDIEKGLRGKDEGNGFSFSLDFETIYLFVSGRITGSVTGAGTIALRPAGAKRAAEVWKGDGGESKLDADLRAALGSRPRAFRLEFAMDKGARIENLRASGIFQYNYFVSPRLLRGENEITVRWAEASPMDGRAVRTTWTWKEKAGEKKEVHTAKKSGQSYGVSVGEIEDPGGGALDPTFIDRLEVEVVPAD
jgi:hypothetical protein